MPKLSISVPDDLWDEARSGAGSTMGASQLVQDALRRLVSDRRLPYSGIAAGSESRLQRIRATKRPEVDRLFAEGYDEGLRAAESCEWEFLDWGASLDFDFERMRGEAERYREEYREYWEVDAILPDDLGTRGRIFDEGTRRALRDAWQTVLADDAPDGEAKETD